MFKGYFTSGGVQYRPEDYLTSDHYSGLSFGDLAGKVWDAADPIQEAGVNLSIQHKESIPAAVKYVSPYGIQFNYSIRHDVFSTRPITPFTGSYFNLGYGPIDFRRGISGDGPGDFFGKNRALITFYNEPFGPNAAYKMQFDIVTSGNNFQSMLKQPLEVGGRHVFEMKMPGLFSPSQSSLEINVGFRVKLRSPGSILNRIMGGKQK